MYIHMCQYIFKTQLLWILITYKTLGLINWDREADMFLNVSNFCVHSTTRASNTTLGQYIGSVLRWLLIEPKRRKKTSLNLAPEPKRHVPRFHLNASTLRGLSKLIIQISCKKVNSRKLLGGGGGGMTGQTSTKKKNPHPNLTSFSVFYKKRCHCS